MIYEKGESWGGRGGWDLWPATNRRGSEKGEGEAVKRRDAGEGCAEAEGRGPDEGLEGGAVINWSGLDCPRQIVELTDESPVLPSRSR